MKNELICVNCIKHPTMRGYWKCTATGATRKHLCYVHIQKCKHKKASLRYRFKHWYRTKGIYYDV